MNLQDSFVTHQKAGLRLFVSCDCVASCPGVVISRIRTNAATSRRETGFVGFWDLHSLNCSSDQFMSALSNGLVFCAKRGVSWYCVGRCFFSVPPHQSPSVSIHVLWSYGQRILGHRHVPVRIYAGGSAANAQTSITVTPVGSAHSPCSSRTWRARQA